MLIFNVALQMDLLITLVVAKITLKPFYTFMFTLNVKLQTCFQCSLVVTLTTIIGNTFMDNFLMVKECSPTSKSFITFHTVMFVTLNCCNICTFNWSVFCCIQYFMILVNILILIDIRPLCMTGQPSELIHRDMYCSIFTYSRCCFL